MPISPADNTPSSQPHILDADADHSASTVKNDRTPLPSAPAPKEAEPNRTAQLAQTIRGKSVEQNLRKRAAEVEQASSSQPSAKAPRFQSAKNRLKARKEAWRKETGALSKEQRTALSAGFKKENGEADPAAYRLHFAKQTARDTDEKA